MSLHIRAVATPSLARLRQLLVEALPQLLGAEARALPAAGPMPEATLIAVDSYQRLWVLSFTNHDPGRALLDGTAALQQVRELLPWLRQARMVAAEVKECSLLVLTPELPAGSQEIARRAGVEWRQLRTLEVNGELGLLIEGPPTPVLKPDRTAECVPERPPERAPVATTKPPAAAASSATATLTPLPRRDSNRLSPEEEAFFQHL